MNRLVFPFDGWLGLRERLLADAPLEAAAIVLANTGKGVSDYRFLVTDVLWPNPDDYLERTSISATLTPAFIASALKRARLGRKAMFLVHTHPGEVQPEFSRKDSAGERLLAPSLYGRAPDGPHGSIVIGSEGFSARLVDPNGEVSAKLDYVSEVGRDIRGYSASPLETIFAEMFDRNIRTFGKEGQSLLSSLTVGVVGVGGTGSVVVEELARLGVGHMIFIDNETIETTNLNRVLGSATTDVGRPKVDVASDNARQAREIIKTTQINGSIIEESVGRYLLDCDFVFCCTDSHGSRAVINQVAYQYLVPTIDIGIRIDAEEERVSAITTRVQMLAPSLACLACHPLLDPAAVRADLMTDTARAADPYIVGFFEPQPAVISINATAASSAVTMFISAITGLPSPARHLIGRPLDGVTRPIVSTPRPGCVVCSSENALSRADSWPMMWRRSATGQANSKMELQ